jgi:signal transduction histidine kinase/CheY-like chemotaxis protein/HPt (histidine-containing phosphotransfer) domain-containing protein
MADYSFSHSNHHTWFKTITRLRGYYDIFLISPGGDVLYSMFKEQDFATNLRVGPWSKTGLAQVFKEIVENPTLDHEAYSDFQAYEPSNNAPAAFFARPVFSKGRLAGILALQMPISRINEVMQDTSGMGKTGETYAVGPGYLMHSDSRFSRTSTILKTEVRTQAVTLALDGKSSVMTIKDYRGIPVLSAFRPLQFQGAVWALLAEKDIAEIDLPAQEMLRSILLIGFALTVLVAAIGIFLARSITRPLAAVSHSVSEFRQTRRANVIPEARRKDEIGEIADGFSSAATDLSAYIEMINEAREELVQNEQELVTARDSAQAATEAKAMFLATMSHEIRTPMTGIIGMVDLLTQSKMDDDQRKMSNTVRDSAYALLTIINDILDFSKIEAGKLELEMAPFSLRDVVEGMAETLGPNANNKGVKINIHVDPEIPDALLGDQVRLRQILFNIGGNAVKFTEQGRVLIRAFAAENQTIGKTTVRFEIIDSGIGISEEAQADLFTEFSQAESSTTRRFGGTGLGLSICLRLTKMMAGEIDVESIFGEGSTFIVTLSFDEPEQHKIKSDGFDLQDLNILFAGSDLEECELDARYLRHWGAEVVLTEDIHSVRAAVMDASSHHMPFDVVILASSWPMERRYGLVREIQQEPETASTRFVLLTETRTKAEREEIDNVVYSESDPIRRGAFIRVTAIAAGRASPDISYDDDEILFETIEAPTIEAARADGRLILVAEDNKTNQDVIRRQVNMLGYAVEILDDGKQALDAYQLNDYAMLLTDCHMPVMDGFELTQSIRQTEKGSDRHLPIVAITASVLAAEIDRCYEAGMDDSLNKPLEMPKLKAALKKWMPANDDGEVVVLSQVEPPEPTGHKPQILAQATQSVDANALKNIFGDDPDTIREILEEFIEPASGNVAQIQSALADRNSEEVAGAAHKLKSSCRTIGANQLADICQTLETCGNDDNWTGIDEVSPGLDTAFQQVTAWIEQNGR